MKLRITNCELRMERLFLIPILTFFILCFFAPACSAQTFPDQDTLHLPSWISDPALFLEPNHFGVVKELGNRSLWLQMGFGKTIIGNQWLQIGLEGLAWSRLRTLSDFRFPVETVDYFFGMFFTKREGDDEWKLRISHISSHLVDGTDTVAGGSSSHYSREFVELSDQIEFKNLGIRTFLLTLGLRGYFHQVTKIEPWIAAPACLTWTFAHFFPNLYYDVVPAGSNYYTFSAFVSSGDGPVWPTLTAGLRADQYAKDLGILDLELYYQYGASWAGTDAGVKRSTINLQMDVRGF